MLAVTFETFRQLTVDGFFRGCSYGLLGVGFALDPRRDRAVPLRLRVHVHAGRLPGVHVHVPDVGAGRSGRRPSSASCWPAVVGAGIERGVYRPLARNAGATALLAVFVAALGIGIAGENLIRLPSGANTQAYFGPRKTAHVIWDAIYINFDWWQAASGIAITLALAAMLRYTALGRQIKATRVNPDLAKTIGIDADRVYVIVFFLGTICAGVAAFWYALKYTVDPAMGTLPDHLRLRRRLPRRHRPLADPGLPDGHRRRPHRAVRLDLAVGAVHPDGRVRRARRLPHLPGDPVQRLHGEVQEGAAGHAARACTAGEG